MSILKKNFIEHFQESEGVIVKVKLFADKVKDARSELRMTQPHLAELVGISSRSIVAYEKGEKKPRQSTMLRLAKTLKVSVKFLSDDNCTNPMEDIEKDGYIEDARERYGTDGARDIDALMAANAALFAGGDVSQEEKDAFFDAIMKAYITCKEEAKAKYGKKNKSR